MSDYDTWIMTPAYDDEPNPNPCQRHKRECGTDACTCAQDEADERGDALYHAMKDDEQ